LGRAIFGSGTILYYLVQAATTLILVLAANTAYADFPRLASIVSRDRFLPRQFMNQGDRLAFSNGILVLSSFAAILIVAVRGCTQSLLPLYMIGVFVCRSRCRRREWSSTGGSRRSRAGRRAPRSTASAPSSPPSFWSSSLLRRRSKERGSYCC